MKTTVEISSPLLKRAKAVARRRGTTLRALIERGLRHVLDQQDDVGSQFRLEDASVDGQGLAEGLDNADWSRILERAYEDRD